jgi:hypothetical protein
MIDVGKFYGHSVDFTAILYIVWDLVYFVAILVYFPRFWYAVP